MTRVILFEDAEGIERGFEAKGHSGYGFQGNDIVCAAVSVLTFTTVNAIEALTEERPEVLEKEGNIRCTFPEAPGKDARLLLQTYALGIRDISEQYGEHVQVTVRRYK